MNLTRTTVAIAGIGLALSLSACSSSPDTEEASAAWCEGAAKVATEIATMEGLIESGATTDAVKVQFNAVEAAIQANSVPLSQLEDATQEELGQAYEEFSAAIEAIPADASPSEAAPEYKAAIDGLTADVEAVKAEVGCS
ncbi:MAG: hypothetical protein MUF09_09120 [Candidatus Nanopelagicales bacterium]|jgi:hypothetical protein|nr:hypothetical protein [Candidatus Nanopelagicales bacterium]